jgi:hypothetical protein
MHSIAAQDAQAGGHHHHHHRHHHNGDGGGGGSCNGGSICQSNSQSSHVTAGIISNSNVGNQAASNSISVS